MNMLFKRRLPAPQDVIKMYPLSEKLASRKNANDKEIRGVLEGKNKKFLLIIGPCSADREDAVLEYATRLRAVQEKVSDKLILVPRIYTNKPRTTGAGYKGMLHQSDPHRAPDMFRGLISIRRLHIRCLEETGFSGADEMLYPENHRYLADILSYVAVGARSAENQQHRLTASGLDVPVGFKNPTSGDLSVMLNAVTAAQSPHDFSRGAKYGQPSRTRDSARFGKPLRHQPAQLSLRRSDGTKRFIRKQQPSEPRRYRRRQPFEFRETLRRTAAHRERNTAQHEAQRGCSKACKRRDD